MRQLFVDLGHSVKFPGASGVIQEVTWIRSIWKPLSSLLDPVKWRIILVPDTYPTDIVPSPNWNLVQRIKFINKNSRPGDVVLSIHGNASVNKLARGVETCFYSGSDYAQKLAQQLSMSYSTITGIPLFGDGSMGDMSGRFGRIGMIRDTKPLALLIECGFVTNAQDMSINPDAAARGISAFFNSEAI